VDLPVKPSTTAAVVTSLCAVACAESHELPRGQLMVALSTDMSVPKDLDELRFQVFRADGSGLPERQIPILPAEPAPFGKPLPGTLAIVPSDVGGQQLRIVVSARRLDPSSGSEPSRVVREASVELPTDRAALLRMRLAWLCTGIVEPVEGTDDGFRSACGAGQTCVAGSCRPAAVDSEMLPDYAAAAVFGGGDAAGESSRCLDMQTCFAGARVDAPDSDDCSVPLPSGADRAQLNVALVLGPHGDGHCLGTSDGTATDNCYVPLDDDPDEGFHVERRRIVLPRAACDKPGVLGVAASTRCPTKDASVPVCGPWTGWPEQSELRP
jgi:hypothetical protein